MLNVIHLQGRLTKDPSLRHTSNGTSYVYINIACEKAEKANRDKEVDFIPCIAWGNKADSLYKKYKKGDMILIDGRLSSRNYEDSEGIEHVAYEVCISNVYDLYNSKSNKYGTYFD